jgi:hypothetical protein
LDVQQQQQPQPPQPPQPQPQLQKKVVGAAAGRCAAAAGTRPGLKTRATQGAGLLLALAQQLLLLAPLTLALLVQALPVLALLPPLLLAPRAHILAQQLPLQGLVA